MKPLVSLKMMSRANPFPATAYLSSATQRTFDRLKDHFPHGSWLHKKNPYAKNCTECIYQQIKRNPSLKKVAAQNQLAEYIAASVPLHCMDGWSLLGRALISHITGDVASCKHFAYYAQLRAVMSLLANEGIGIFWDKHFSITSAGERFSRLSAFQSGNTHEMAKQQFEDWAKSESSGDLMKKIIRPRGDSFEDWFSYISASSGPLTQDWLKQWGYDLTTFRDDSSARNQASYRPSGLYRDFRNKNSDHIQESIDLVMEIWNKFSPHGDGGFTIDLFLLKRSWQKVAKRTNLDPRKVGIILDRMGIEEPELTSLKDLFCNGRQDPLILVKAAKKGGIHSSDYHIQMLCRAALLLRLATGAARQLIQKAYISKDEISFWWEAVSEDLGLWENGLTDPISNMWDEVSVALENLKSESTKVNNHHYWRSEMAKESFILSGCERIGLSQLCI